MAKKRNKKKNDFKERLKAINDEVNRVLGSLKDEIQVIRKAEDLHDYISSCISSGAVAIDTETNNSLDPLTCEMMGLCLYGPNLKQAYVPLNHRDYVSKKKLPFQLTYTEVAEELNRLPNSNIEVIMHNGKFDYEVIKHTCKINIIPTWDTMIAAKILNENEPAGLKWQYKFKIDSNQALAKAQ